MGKNGGARPGSGRKPGTPNKDKKELIEMIQDKFPDWHPLMAMAEMAQKGEYTVTKDGIEKKVVDENLKFQACKEVCKYIVPQLSSVDARMITDGELKITVEYARDSADSPEASPGTDGDPK